MSSSKRRSANGQLRREEYEDQEDEVVEAGTFKRASAAELSKRRIISVSPRFKATAKTSNPFAQSATKVNPFAAVSLTAPTTKNSKTIGTKEMNTEEEEKRRTDAFMQWIERQMKRAPSSNWSIGVSEYLKEVKVPEIQPEAVEKKKPALIKEIPAQIAPLTVEPAPTSMFFSPPPPAVNNQNNETSSPAPAKSLFPSFSFSGGSTSTPLPFGTTQQPPPTNDQAGEEEEEDAMPAEAPAEVLRTDDGDENSLFESRAGIRRFDRSKKKWIDFGEGTARLMQHKSTQAKRMVVRNDVGKVVLNFKIDPQMTFSQGKRGLAFQAITDPSLGLQNYLLITKDAIQPDQLKPASYTPAPAS